MIRKEILRMNTNKSFSALYQIRNLLIGIFPLYVSILSVLLFEIRKNVELFYSIGVILFFVATVIANALLCRCNTYNHIYDIKMTVREMKREMGMSIEDKPKRKSIYTNKESEINQWYKIFQYVGVFVFAFAGLLICIIRSCK